MNNEAPGKHARVQHDPLLMAFKIKTLFIIAPVSKCAFGCDLLSEVKC